MTRPAPALLAAGFLALALPACESTSSSEPALTLADTPPAVASAVRAAYPGAEVLEVEREDDAPGAWEIEVLPAAGGPVRELTVDAAGNVLDDEAD